MVGLVHDDTAFIFWGGRLFTPDFQLGGENVQDFLQGHYLRAMGEVARRLADLPNVLGFDTLNEPGLGWMGEPLSYRHFSPTAELGTGSATAVPPAR